MKYTISKIKGIEQCGFHGYLSTLGYHTEQNKFLHLLDLYKRAIKENKEQDVFFDEEANRKFYTFDQEFQVDKNLFFRNIHRLDVYLTKNQGEVIDSNIVKTIKFLDQEIRVKIDFVVAYGSYDPSIDERDEREIEMVKLSMTQPKLSYSKRASEKNVPKNNFELYLMQLVGEQLYFKEVSSAFYHMKGKHDGLDSKNPENRQDYHDFLEGKSRDLYGKLFDLESLVETTEKKTEANKIKTRIKKLKAVLELDGDEGSHIIRQTEFNVDYITEQLNAVFDTELSMDTEKCIDTHCSSCQHYVIC